jgi:HlyD family secretion protein
VDIPIEKKQPSRPTLLLSLLAAAIVVGAGVVVLSSIATPEISAKAISLQVVHRGQKQFAVPGYGVFVPQIQKLQTAPAAALVEEILSQPGKPVNRGDVMLRLSAPKVQQQLIVQKSLLQKAEAELIEAVLAAKLSKVTQAEVSSTLASQLMIETKDMEARQDLASTGIVPKLSIRRQEALVSGLKTQVAAQLTKAEVTRQIELERIGAKERSVAQQREQFRLAEREVALLQVSSPIDGVIQETFVVLGQAVVLGEKLTQVADTRSLIAALQVPQNKAASLSIGAKATLKVQQKSIEGRVVRIDPKVRNDAVQVDIAPSQDLPAGVRGSQSVVADIEGSSAVNSLFVKKADGLAAYEKRDVFVKSSAARLVRRNVRFGASSGDYVEILAGVTEGESIATGIPAENFKFAELKIKE